MCMSNQLLNVRSNKTIVCPPSSALVYTQSVCHILEVVCGPVAALLKEQLRRNKARKESLLKEKQQLQDELGQLAGVEI